ncbi:MAG: site-2 protease family protein [Phycisphaerales bacterium]|nr:site-2 protease family protein [Phycisphaerales bacterium]
MFDLPGIFGTLANLLVVIIGFSLIVFVHELGHFVAAKWARIRVLAFSMGIGPIVCSYRKGIGFRRGSSEPEYLQLLKEAAGVAGDARENARDQLSGKISPTEYRFSALPLGGYVKMLGQEDINPGAVSDAPDSYQNCPVPKRMVVISAGVIMNIITAAILFIIVFMVGLQSNPPIVGSVINGSPALQATAPGITPGLQRGDVITRINNTTTYGYRDIATAIAMSSKSEPSTLTVERPGVDEPIVFSVMPVKSPATGLLDLGVLPPQSTRVLSGNDPDLWSRLLNAEGLNGFNQGDELVAVNAQPADSPYAILDAVDHSDGKPISVTLRGDEGTHEVTLQPIRESQTELVQIDDSVLPIEHLLGLTGVLTVNAQASPKDTKQGLMPGDEFLRIGPLNNPSQPDGVRQVRALAGQSVEIEVFRGGAVVPLTVEVSNQGTIGFYQGSSFESSNIVGAPLKVAGKDSPASRLITRPGTRILSINNTPISTLSDLAPAIIAALQPDYLLGQGDRFDLRVEMRLPLPTQPDGTEPIVTETWTLSRDEVKQVMDLGWRLPSGEAVVNLFEPVIVIDKSPDPIAAVKRGLHESQRVMATTYLTFVRLFQGSVALKQLKGPVGIAHVGTQIANDGLMMVLFFMGLISVNLAVINFLPLPIVDGGQFLMLLYEGIRRKPLPIPVQNAVTMVGLVLIAGVFLYITFHDVSRLLFGGL